MSHSTSSSATPLSDILPWGSPITTTVSGTASNNATTTNIKVDDRTLLVTDACSTDGRFLLHTLALQFLSSRHAFETSSSCGDRSVNELTTAMMEGAVLWISCAPVSEKQVMMGLRKGLQHNLGGGTNTAGPPSSWMGSGKGNATSSGSSGSSFGRVHIVSITLELADAALELDQQQQENDFSNEKYLKRLHQRIVYWLSHRELLQSQQQQSKQLTGEKKDNASNVIGPNLIIIDNATALGTLFGDTLANAFIASVRSSMKKHTKSTTTNSATTNVVTVTNLLTIRASSPDDGGLYQLDGDENIMKGEKLRSEYARLLRPWLGFGSGMSSSNEEGAGTDILQMEEQTNYMSLSPNSTPSLLYKSGLYECVDGIVDVSPLESGYARDVLGRLSFSTTWNGKGWWGSATASGGNSSVGSVGGSSGVVTRKKEDAANAYASICVNYRCDDSGVRVMRLRSS